MNLAIIGATGNVGRKTIEILENLNISFKNLYLVASKKSAGQKLLFKKKGELYLVSLIKHYLKSKIKIYPYKIKKFVHLGTPEQYSDFINWKNIIKSKNKKIDPKITHKIWKSMIKAFIDYEFRNFNKK